MFPINRIFGIDRLFSINYIFSIDIIFWKKENTKSDNLTVYCLDPQWPSGPLRSNHYIISVPKRNHRIDRIFINERNISIIINLIEEILWIIWMDETNIIISTNTKMSIKIYASNNRIIIKESFALIRYLFFITLH